MQGSFGSIVVGRVVKVPLWIVFFSRCLAVVIVELVNLPSWLANCWLFMALIVFFVIVHVWGFRYCEMSGFDSFPKLKLWQN